MCVDYENCAFIQMQCRPMRSSNWSLHFSIPLYSLALFVNLWLSVGGNSAAKQVQIVQLSHTHNRKKRCFMINYDSDKSILHRVQLIGCARTCQHHRARRCMWKIFEKYKRWCGVNKKNGLSPRMDNGRQWECMLCEESHDAFRPNVSSVLSAHRSLYNQATWHHGINTGHFG